MVKLVKKKKPLKKTKFGCNAGPNYVVPGSNPTLGWFIHCTKCPGHEHDNHVTIRNLRDQSAYEGPGTGPWHRGLYHPGRRDLGGGFNFAFHYYPHRRNFTVTDDMINLLHLKGFPVGSFYYETSVKPDIINIMHNFYIRNC
jgi:hypothetical protein